MTCVHCGGSFRTDEHVAPARALRRVDVRCRDCGRERALWFRIVEAEPN